MRTRLSSVVALVILASLVLIPGLVVADMTGVAGPETAKGPGDGWVMLPAGTTHWYAFDYSGWYELYEEDEEEEDNGVIEEGEDNEEEEEEYIFVSTPVKINLDAEPDGSAGFSLWTGAQVEMWARGEAFPPFGRGTANRYEPGDVHWGGVLGKPGRYYVLVQNVGSAPSYYTLSITGENVAFPGSEAALAPPPPEPLPAAGIGSGPEQALAPASTWQGLQQGEKRWYAFDYVSGMRVKVRLDAEPDRCTGFSVWTEEQAQLWGLGQEVEPVGQGTPNQYEPGDLFWGGTLGSPGRYYVVVETLDATSCQYALEILQ